MRPLTQDILVLQGGAHQRVLCRSIRNQQLTEVGASAFSGMAALKELYGNNHIPAHNNDPQRSSRRVGKIRGFVAPLACWQDRHVWF